MIDTAKGLTNILPVTGLDMAQGKRKETTVESDTFQATLKKAVANGEDKKLRDACQQFEAVFINQMLQRMRATVPKDGFWGDSMGVKIFQDMQDEQTSKDMSTAGGMGLGEMLYQQMKPKDNVVTLEEALTKSQGTAKIDKLG